MQTHSLIIEPSSGCPFRTEVLRFVPSPSYEDGLTLLFFHATNLHKEALTSLITELLKTASPLRINDVWAFDNPNHGRSAALNRALLMSDEYREKWTPMESMGAAYALLTTRTHGVDFSKRKLVVISQSGGSNAAIMLQKIHPELPYYGYILLDPGIPPTGHPNTPLIFGHYQKMALLKNDIWATKDEARHHFLNKGGFRNFNPVVLESFLECGLRPLGDRGAVTLSSTKVHDFVFHASKEAQAPPAEALVALCEGDKMPVHLIVALKDEFRGITDAAKAFQIALVKKTSRGGVHLIEKGGHLFPQVEPALAARHVRNALLMIWDQEARARL